MEARGGAAAEGGGGGSRVVTVGTSAAMPSSSRASVPPTDFCFIVLDRLRAAVTTCSCTTSLA